ncbi:MAG: hypothetical protein P8R42_28645 [Candidatus Binatia bacterium]|nr:hypothetical protein [Candidatus Binatia bacterium]
MGRPSRGVSILERDGREVERSYASLRTRAEQLARGLARAGVQPGDLIVLRLQGIENQLLGFCPAVFAGAIALPSFSGPEDEMADRRASSRGRTDTTAL